MSGPRIKKIQQLSVVILMCVQAKAGFGGDGSAYSCTSNICDLSGGVQEFSRFDISSNATVHITGPDPLYLKVVGDVAINGTLEADGANGMGYNDSIGGAGGAGGDKGGNGGNNPGSCSALVPGTAGMGPGGGARGDFKKSGGQGEAGGGGGGFGGAGGRGGVDAGVDAGIKAGTLGGIAYGSALNGGSGGGGSDDGMNCTPNGGGGGGGGAIRITSGGTVFIGKSGRIRANGGNGGNDSVNPGQKIPGGGGGSGGGVYIQAVTITNNGSIQAKGGDGGNNGGGGGGGGRVALYDADGVVKGTVEVTGGTTQNKDVYQLPGTAGADGQVTYGRYPLRSPRRHDSFQKPGQIQSNRAITSP